MAAMKGMFMKMYSIVSTESDCCPGRLRLFLSAYRNGLWLYSTTLICSVVEYGVVKNGAVTFLPKSLICPLRDGLLRHNSVTLQSVATL